MRVIFDKNQRVRCLMIALFFVVISCGLPIKGLTQNEDRPCETRLQEAQKAFDAGQMYSIPDLKECMLNENRAYISRALKLYTLIYLYQEEDSLARETFELLLKNDPEFRPEPDDPSQLQFMYQEYRTEPRLALGFSTGLVNPAVGLIQEFGTDLFDEGVSVYNGQLSYHFGGTLYNPLSENWWLATEFRFLRNNIEFRQDLLTESDSGLVSSQLFMSEWQNWLEVSLSSRYHFNPLPLPFEIRLQPYCYIGAAGYYLQSNQLANINRTINSAVHDPDLIPLDTIIRINTDERPISLKEDRNPFNISYQVGIGVLNKVRRGYVYLDFRYSQMLLNLARGDRRYRNDEIQNNFGYVDNDVRLRTSSFTLGYVHLFYRPRLKEPMLPLPNAN